MGGAVDPSADVDQKQGRIGKALVRLFMKRASIVANEELSDRFRLVTLEGQALQGVQWVPGQKVQIAMGSAFAARTYTPVEWDAANGRTSILGFAHGSGPGSKWLLRAEAGDECNLFGPRSSLDFRPLEGPLAIFGDETSIGLAYAVAQQNPLRSVSSYFEVGDAISAALVIDRLGLAQARLFERDAGDGHIAAMEAMLSGLMAAGNGFILTGKAGTVQRLRHMLKQIGVPSGRIKTKAYWAPGKIGLD